MYDMQLIINTDGCNDKLIIGNAVSFEIKKKCSISRNKRSKAITFT